jgi:hypothetical protein
MIWQLFYWFSSENARQPQNRSLHCPNLIEFSVEPEIF